MRPRSDYSHSFTHPARPSVWKTWGQQSRSSPSRTSSRQTTRSPLTKLTHHKTTNLQLAYFDRSINRWPNCDQRLNHFYIPPSMETRLRSGFWVLITTAVCISLLLCGGFSSVSAETRRPKNVQVALRAKWSGTSLLLEAGYACTYMFFFTIWAFDCSYILISFWIYWVWRVLKLWVGFVQFQNFSLSSHYVV